METIKAILLLLVIALAISKLEAVKEKKAKLVKNGYDDVLIAIHNDVKEEADLIEKIKEMMMNASASLLQATKKRAFFRSIKILVPYTWKTRQYHKSTDETYKLADIRIEYCSPNANCTHTPKAFWSLDQECGKQMDHIHLTSLFVTSCGEPTLHERFRPVGKTIVHEWAHYRWGVFDEYPMENETIYEDISGAYQVTRCPKSIKLKFVDDTTGKSCHNPTNPLNWLPNGCHVKIDETQPQELKTSMMNNQFISSVTTFCHSDTNDKMNMHNTEANNQHNKHCNRRSTWDVISKSVDFASDNFPNDSIKDTTPQFSIIQAKPTRIVLVMDTSGSMNGERLKALRKSAKYFLSNYVIEGTHVGLVSFQSELKARTLHPLTEVSSEYIRQQLISSLPASVTGGTSIGSGISKGIEVLEQEGLGPEGGILIVLTDGEETESPWVSDVVNDVLEKKVVVHSIFYGLANAEAKSLEDLSKQSHGRWYYKEDSVGLDDEFDNIFLSLASQDNGGSSKSVVSVASETILVPKDVVKSNGVSIDGSIGNRMVFKFSWMKIEPHLKIMPPKSSCYYSNREDTHSISCGKIHTSDTVFKTLEFRIPGKAEVGLWRYEISSSDTDYITVSVTSVSSVKAQQPVTLEPDVIVKENSGTESVVIVAQVFQGIQPIIGATVNATITRPVGGQVEISLKDNGAGSDHTANDGIYTRYFTHFTAQGRYAFKVRVYKDGNKDTTTNTGNSPATKDLLDLNWEKIPPAKITGVLERIASGPGFAYIPKVATGDMTTSDTFPPNRINDLSVKQIDLNNASAGFLVSFTAPGDDFDSGAAARYEIRCTNGPPSLLLSNFVEQIRLKQMTGGGNAIPKKAMSPENIVVTLPALPDSPSIRLAFAMKSYDDVGNPSEVSNIAIITFFVESPQKLRLLRRQYLLGLSALRSLRGRPG